MAVVAAVLLVTPLVVWASHFEDVPDDHLFHDDIAWMADNGVTFGCNPPENTQFCPNDDVTRAQMSAFIRRLAEGQVVDAATALEADHAAEADHASDSDTVAGLTPDQIVSGYGDSGPSGVVENLAFQTNVTVEEITVEVPGEGFLSVTGGLSILDSQPNTALVWLQLDNTACDNTGAAVGSVGFGYVSTVSNAARGGSVYAEGIVPISAGPHTLTLCAREFAGNGNPSVYSPTISALYLENATVSPGLHSDSGGNIPGADG